MLGLRLARPRTPSARRRPVATGICRATSCGGASAQALSFFVKAHRLEIDFARSGAFVANNGPKSDDLVERRRPRQIDCGQRHDKAGFAAATFHWQIAKPEGSGVIEAGGPHGPQAV